MEHSRREFLKIAAVNSALLISVGVPSIVSSKNLRDANQNKHNIFNIYLTIFPDNTIEIASPVQDMGQHMKTTGPMLIAEEMNADWSLVSCVAGSTHLEKNVGRPKFVQYKYADMNTGGSHALRNNWDYLRQAGAAAKYLLENAAAQIWTCNSSNVIAKNSFVTNRTNSERISYGDLAEIASKIPLPPDLLKLKERSQYTIIGESTTTVDIDQIITGKPLFGIDMDYPNQLHAVVLRCPYFFGKIESYDDSKAMHVDGVVSIFPIEATMSGSQKGIPAGIAVIAKTLWSAMKAKKIIRVHWGKGEWKNENSEAMRKGLEAKCIESKDGKISRNNGDVDKGFEQSINILDQNYFVPFLHHACMEPFSCIADVRESSATIITGHQSPSSAATWVAEAVGIEPLNVDVQSHRMGGGFGRKWSADFVTEAAVISQKIKAPVKVTWMREDEMEQDYFAPMHCINIKAGIDKHNRIDAWHYKQAKKRGGTQENCFPANLIPNYRVEVFEELCGTAIGPWRGPGHLQYTFATECMLDEVAHKVSQDPLEFRKRLYAGHNSYPYKGYGATEINAERMWRCYERAAKMANWKKPRGKNIGVGIAGHFTFGSYAAFVVEVEIKNNGVDDYRVTKCWGAIDCGLAVNPNHIRNQMEGGFIDGLNAAMFNQADISEGRVKTRNFDTLQMTRMAQSPLNVEVSIIENSYPPTGVGEPPTAPAAAALSNAVFSACGQRIRELPIKLEV